MKASLSQLKPLYLNGSPSPIFPAREGAATYVKIVAEDMSEALIMGDRGGRGYKQGTSREGDEPGMSYVTLG